MSVESPNSNLDAQSQIPAADHTELEPSETKYGSLLHDDSEADTADSDDDDTATKYGPQQSRYLTDSIVMSDHALDRYDERLPDGALPPALAWRYGEDIKHPHVAQSDDHDTPPDRVRIYRHNGEWAAVFLVIDKRDEDDDDDPIDELVVTVNSLDGFDHSPTRAYLAAHEPYMNER